MKLLLTSNGLANQNIIDALSRLTGDAFSNLNAAFIPTAAVPENMDKGWLVNDMNRFHQLGFNRFDILELAALDTDDARKRLEESQVIIFGGGDTYFLSRWVERIGDHDYWQQLFENRVYVGISAGSIISNPQILMSSESSVWPGVLAGSGDQNQSGFGFVDFYLRPHFMSPDFPCSQVDVLQKVAPQVPGVIYAVDDESALLVDNGNIEIIGDHVRVFE